MSTHLHLKNILQIILSAHFTTSSSRGYLQPHYSLSQSGPTHLAIFAWADPFYCLFCQATKLCSIKTLGYFNLCMTINITIGTIDSSVNRENYLY